MKNEQVKLSHNNKVADGIKLFGFVNIIDIEFNDFNDITKDIDTKNTDNNTNNSININNIDDSNTKKDYTCFIWNKEILDDEELLIWEKTISNEIKKGKKILNMARLQRIENNESLLALAKNHNVSVRDISDPEIYKKVEDYAYKGLDGIKPKVLTIVGTGRQSGKFTACMTLKNELTNKGINLGVLGTEPQSMICGADEMVIPQPIPICHVAPTILGVMKKIEMENNLTENDLMIVSGQTGIFANPLEVGTGRGGSVISIALLLGSNPDYILLASDLLDLEDITKHILATELLTGKKVIGVTVNSKKLFDSESDEEISLILRDISKKLNLPVTDVIGRINLDELLEEIIKLLKNN
ncbi:DUF1611 domain-containing protein [Methanococcus voltae]|uniref:NAD-dependent epimerase/dehydratase family protein n=1 Tax=Methanococcus voltae PS TaxID=523842 RepID=A0ABT2EZD4_METVO|nr:DUF1611 domain-containing protein [Methanococcus voltae]MBP2172910.1 putative NAD-dependent epimerase/dehydratase family protein [Methanococcus voltae]MCS3922468.1 putative NAD-dependent epimerase/dehydratase family protein [Methanococcus voltae PS]